MRVPALKSKSPLAAVQPLLALGVKDGVFVVVVAPKDFVEIKAFSRVESDPLPRFVASEGYFNAQHMEDGQIIYTAYIPWAGAHESLLQLGCTTVTRRKPLFQVSCLPYESFEPSALVALVKRFGRALLPAFKATLSEDHWLTNNSNPKIPASEAQGNLMASFDGAIDGKVHGWVKHTALGQQSISVELLLGDEIVARGPADYFLDPSNSGQAPTGSHRFRLPVSYELFNDQVHALSVRTYLSSVVALKSSEFELALGSNPHSQLDLIPRTESLALATKLAQASKVIDSKASSVVVAKFSQVSLLQETGQLSEARFGYQQLINLLGQNPLTFCKIAETWLIENNYKNALAAYKAALQLDPNYFWASLGLANVLRLTSKTLQAEDAYRAALKAAPYSFAVQRRLLDIRSSVFIERIKLLLDASDKTGAIAMIQSA